MGEQFVEFDIDQDPALHDRYTDEVPVTLVDGKQIAFIRVDEARLRRSLGHQGL